MSSVVPEGWITSRIQEVVLKVIDNRGKTPPLSDSGYNLIEVACVRDDKQFLDYEKITKCVSEDTYQTWFRNGHPKVGDTIVPTVGSIGEFAFVRENRGCIAQNLVALRPSAVIEPLFLYFQCYSEVVQNNISRILMGAVQPSLRVPNFLETSLLLPPLPEQKKIASILTSVDEVIENTQKQIDKLQDLKKATMNELLTKGIGHTEFKDSELGRIPASWEVIELSSLVNSTRPITYGIVQTGEHIPYGIPCVRVVDIVQGKPILERMIRTTQQINDSYSRTVLQENDIMFALRGNIGFVRKVQSFLRGANLTRGIALISNSEEITSDYLLYALQSQVVRRQIADGVNGSALQEIPLGNLRTVRVPVPCKTEQTGISKVIASLDKLIETSLLKLSQTQSLKKSLMQDLLTGKVRVTVN